LFFYFTKQGVFSFLCRNQEDKFIQKKEIGSISWMNTADYIALYILLRLFLTWDYQ
jgi:hypothetical protein